MVARTGSRGGPAENAVAPTAGGSPIASRILLGAQLRRLREAKQISPEQAGYVIRASDSKISRLETGRVGFKDRDIADLLTLYGVTDETRREEIRGLASRANSPGWWQGYSDMLAGWFEEYLGLEEAAVQIGTYEAQLVPGLLQTEDYAGAVIMLQYSHPKEISRRIDLRMARQAILTNPNPTSLWAVIDEAALTRPLGGPRAMRAQLKHLIEMSQRPNVTIQIMPFTSGGHAAAGGSFSLLHFAEDELPDLVYLEQLASAQYLAKPDVVDTYLEVLDRLRHEAVSAAGSLKTLQARLRQA
ncbi:MAG TPA: helix-turn-helix transcriptional regulator [Streptosporangiaceae bacterium]|nr:helix-turn-helix transcriptional regulator [Streptosporangiaceae bacterium]